MRELSFTDVSHSYVAVDGGVTRALDGLSLTVASGQSVAVIGPSGCGKSSMLQMAAGLLVPSEGTVAYDGAPLEGPRRETALILQDFGLLPWKTVIGNAELGLKVRKVPKAERRDRARDALRLVGLEGFEDKYPGELSGGMRQRLALARSLALDVDTLLMDEPLSALDALLREQLQETLLSLWRKEGYAQVLVTHSIEEAVYLGQRVYVLSPRPGRVVGVVENPGMGSDGFRGSDEYASLVNEVRELLHEGSRPAEGEEVGAHA